jgi:subtilisin family serine protease
MGDEMETVAAIASKNRPTRLSALLDRHRHARAIMVAVAIVGSALTAFGFGLWHDDRVLMVDESKYVSVAALFVAALAMERLTELLIAPWLGGGTGRLDRNIVVGSFALWFGVVISGFLGLRLLALFRGDIVGGSGWIGDHLAPAIDVFATGLAIGAGGKPLHDVISGLEKSAVRAKAASDAAPSPAATEPPLPRGGSFRLALAIKPLNVASLRERVGKLLPNWSLEADTLVHTVTASVPGSSQYVQELFSAAHRLHSDGFAVTPLLSPTGAIAAVPAALPHRRWALDSLMVDPSLQERATGGRGIKIAVLDTGVREHPDGVDAGRVVGGWNILDDNADTTDPLLTGADWLDRDLMGAPGHGTGVAAVMAAGGETTGRYTPEWWRDSRMIGVAPEATVVPFRVMRGPLHLLDDDVAKGVQRAVDDGCDVISMSLGGFAFVNLAEQIDAAVARGTIVICAAGNQFGVVVEPANYPNTVAVSGISPDGQPFFDGASRGPEVAVCAPGVNVLRPDFGADQSSTLEYGTGTTYAAAHVSGVAALWLAQHGRQNLVDAYPGDELPRLFLYLLKKTARPWPAVPGEAELAIDWGAGVVDAGALLAEPVFAEDGSRSIDPSVLENVFRDQDTLAISSRIAGGIGSILAADGAVEIRTNIVAGLLGALKPPRRSTADDSESLAVAQDQAESLLGAELAAHSGANPNFRRAMAAAPTQLPIPDRATPELRLVLDETNRALAAGTLSDDWGVGLSLPLRRALQGVGNVSRGYRWIGMVGLAAAAFAAIIFYSSFSVDTTHVSSTLAGLGGTLSLLGIGIYGGAQAIERMLEFTVGRWAFKDTPGREADRALIMLGAGMLIGTLAAVVLKIGLLTQIASVHPPGNWFGRADTFVTGMAMGGGAKPVHDLLTRIRIAVDNVA